MPIRNPKIIEVDTLNHSTTLRWQIPKAPLNGKLKHYLIKFCDISGQNCHEGVIVRPDEFCKHSFWNSQNTMCKTVSLPSSDMYDQIQVRKIFHVLSYHKSNKFLYFLYRYPQITAYNEGVARILKD